MTNEITNFSFETDLAGWTARGAGTLARDATAPSPPHGVAVCRITGAVGATGGLSVDLVLPELTEFAWEFLARGKTEDHNIVIARVQRTDTSELLVNRTDLSDAPTSVWGEYPPAGVARFYTGEATSGTTVPIRAEVQCESAIGGALDWWTDAWTIEEVQRDNEAVYNGDFEIGTSQWEPTPFFAAIEQTDEAAYSGTNSLKITASSMVLHTGAQTVGIALIPNRDYYLEFHFLSGVAIQFRVTRDDTGETLNVGSVTGDVDEWRYSNLPGSISSGNLSGGAEIPVTLTFTALSAVFLIDNIHLWTPSITPAPVGQEPLTSQKGRVKYIAWLRGPDGEKLRLLPRLTTVSLTHAVSEIGTFTLTLPYVRGLAALIEDGTIIEIRRRVGLGKGEIEFVGFVEDAPRASVIGTEEMLTITGCSPTGLLERRKVTAQAEDAEGNLAGRIDDEMKTAVRRWCGEDAEEARQFDPVMFSVAEDRNEGPQTKRTIAGMVVMDALRELAEQSREVGSEEVFFEVQAVTATRFVFTTAIGQPGDDRRNALRFSPALGNFVGGITSRPFGGTLTHVYYNFGTEVVAADPAPTNSWARREGSEDTRSEVGADEAEAKARATLAKNQAREKLTGQIIGRYGAWRCGDRVRIDAFEKAWDAIIRGVQVDWADNGGETVTAYVDAEATL